MSISGRARQRANVLKELVGSERDHITDLKMVETVFLAPLKTKMKNQALLTTVSGNLSMIVSFNHVLLDELSKKDAEVGKVFCRLADFSKMLVNYCMAQPRLELAVEQERRTNRALDVFLEEAKTKARGLNLGQLLSKPIQRTCKYPLLLQELRKATPEDSPDYAMLGEAIEKTAAVVASINQGQKSLESFAKIAQLVDDLKHDVPDFDLLQKGRTFIREGPFVELRDGKQRRNRDLVMFNDVLIVGKYNRKKFQYKAHYPMALVECAALPAKFVAEKDVGFTLQIKGDAPIQLVWPSKDVKFLWFSEIAKFTTDAQKALEASRRDSFGPMRVQSKQDDAPSRATQKKIDVWKESLEAKQGEVQVLLEKEHQLRQRYDDGRPVAAGEVLEEYPSLLSFAASKMDSVGPLLHLTKRFCSTSKGRPSRPEFVVFGEGSSGRSSLVDALLGGANLIGGMANVKILYIELVHVAKLSAGLWSVEGSAPVPTAVEARDLIRIEFEKKNAGPIVHIKFEAPSCVNALIVDTPALGKSDEWDERILAECSVPHRTLLCVESAKRWEGAHLFPLVIQSRLDPNLERTWFVYTKFYQQLQLFLEGDDLLRFLQQCPCPHRSYFVSLPKPLSEVTLGVEEAAERHVLSQFGEYVRPYEQYFGARCLLQRVTGVAWDFYVKEVFSLAHSRLGRAAETASRVFHERNRAVDSSSPAKVTQVWTRHMQHFAKCYVALMEGCAEVSNVGRGSTLAEEVTQTGAKWHKHQLGAPDVSLSVPFADCRLAAGAKLQRLVNELRKLLTDMVVDSLDTDMVPEKRPLPRAVLEQERVQKSITNHVAPAVQTFGIRLVALVQETCDGANTLALQAASESDAEILSECKLSLLKEHVTVVCHAVLASFRTACADYVNLNIPMIAAHFDASKISADLSAVLYSCVVEPLLDANVILNALHTRFNVDQSYNKYMLDRELKKRLEVAKQEVELLKESLEVFQHHYAAITGGK